MKHILIVDDDEGPRSALCSALEDQYEIFTAQTLKAAQMILNEKRDLIDLVITDYHLGNSGTGSDLANFISTSEYIRVRNLPIIIASADTSQKWSIENQDITFIPKPFKLNQILEKIVSLIGE
jgi:DNA-binding NtrC family response regulator